MTLVHTDLVYLNVIEGERYGYYRNPRIECAKSANSRLFELGFFLILSRNNNGIQIP